MKVLTILSGNTVGFDMAGVQKMANGLHDTQIAIATQPVGLLRR